MILSGNSDDVFTSCSNIQASNSGNNPWTNPVVSDSPVRRNNATCHAQSAAGTCPEGTASQAVLAQTFGEISTPITCRTSETIATTSLSDGRHCSAAGGSGDLSAPVSTTSSAAEHGSLTTVLQISLQEEVVRKRLDETRAEIDQFRMQMLMLKQQLDGRLHMRSMVREVP